jgi:hypothetical protein
VDIAVWLTTTRSAARTKLELLEHLVDALGTGEIDLIVLNAQENVPLAGEVLMHCAPISNPTNHRRFLLV